MDLPDLLKDRFGLCLRSGSNIDLCVLAVQDLNELFPNTTRSSGDENDLLRISNIVKDLAFEAGRSEYKPCRSDQGGCVPSRRA